MKSESHRLIEVLESRIAPARVIIAGIPNSLPNPDTDFNEAPFVNTEDNPLDPISGAVGPGIPGVADTFYLRLSAGDRLQLFRTSAGSSVEDFLTVQSGNIVVFFIDKEDTNGNRNNEVNEADIVGIAAGNNAQFELKAALPGDIVFNLNEQGTPTLSDDTLIMNTPMLPGVNVKGITVGSSVGATLQNGAMQEIVGGKLMASGAIKNVIISGNVDSILAGAAGNGESFDFFPKYIGAGGGIIDTPGGNGVFDFAPAPGKAGSSIQNVTLDSVGNRIEAGVGGEGAKGGSVANVYVRGDADGFSVFGGNGGASNPVKKNGGVGGSVSKVTVSGIDDFVGNNLVHIAAGDGGGATLGKGGAGGTVSGVYVGYSIVNSKRILSNGILRDNVLLEGGSGGDGKVGGKGGFVSTLDILTSTPESSGDELSVIGGNGGNSVLATGGRAGVGGSISNSIIRNVEPSLGSDTGLRAGDGGSSSGLGIGAAGGSVSSLTLLGRQIQVEAGDGSDGKVGGKGGGVSNVVIEERNGIVSDALVFNAGVGGDGNAGKGGSGGDVFGVTVNNSDLNVFTINQGIKADGGIGTGAKGGAGGKVSGIKLLDSDANSNAASNTTVPNAVSIRSGSGGDGDMGGGSGGVLLNISVVGSGLDGAIFSGHGGSALIKGKGGNGGAVSAIETAVTGTVARGIGGILGAPASVTIASGVGGDGAGTSGAGGAGGAISTVSASAPGFGSVVAGDGGRGIGAKAAAGKGGSIILAGVFAGSGVGELIAGDAGPVGAKPGAGGSILSRSSSQLSGLFAELDLTIRAGNGTAGGAGGSINGLGYGSTAALLVPTPNGSILVQAGNGSASPDGKYVGKGGSISNVGGAVNSDNGNTFIRAGDGGAANKKAAAGGSISNLTLQRGGALGVEFSIQAGDGGSAPQGSIGGNGGSIIGVSLAEISTEAVFRNLVAGNGGNALKVGGKGGSISKVNVLDHDIGLRQGEVYGFNSMGGIFAGAGGTGAKEGVNGSVSQVNADAISSIVAGRGPTPKLVTKVENIYLNGGNLLKDSTGAFLPNIPGSEQVFEFGGFSISANETLQGGSLQSEIQTLNVAAIRALPVGTQFTLSFGGQVTAAIDKDATIAEIQSALNALSSVKQTDTVASNGSVVVGGTEPDLTITFSEIGDQVGLISGTVAPQTTAPLPLNATAADVKAALNALPFIIASGGVDVIPSLPSGYQITFNVENNQSQIVGKEIFDVVADEVSPGVGNSAIFVTDSGGVNETHSFAPIAPFDFRIEYTEGGITFTTAQLSANATPSEIQAALEALPTIDPGDITVTRPNTVTGVVNVLFNEIGPHTTLQVTALATELVVTEAQAGSIANVVKETQVIFVDYSGDGPVKVSFEGNVFSLDLSTGFTATDLSNQLNLQPSILAQGGVALTEIAAHTYQVVFGVAGDQSEIVVTESAFPFGYARVLLDGPGSIIQFTHENGASVRFGLGGNVSATVNPGVTGVLTKASIEAAVNSLPGVGANKATAVSRPDNTWEITFAAGIDGSDLNVGQRVSVGTSTIFRGVSTTSAVGAIGIGGAPGTVEQQEFRPGGSGVYVISVGGFVSTPLQFDATATEIEAALNIVLANSGQTAVVSKTVDNVVSVLYTLEGPQPQMFIEAADVSQIVNETVKGSSLTDIKEVQIVEYSGDGEFALKVPVDFTAQEFVRGGEIVRELQTLNLKSVETLAGAEFTLEFGGEASTTPLPNNATALQIQTALNALTTIQAVGNVTVVDRGNGGFDITFLQVGDKADLISASLAGGVSTPILAGTSTMAEIAQALNQLSPIASVGGVTVEKVDSDSFNIIFNQAGQMPSIQAFFRVRETQVIDFFQAGDFQISFGADPADTTTPIPAGSSIASVEAALNALPGVAGAGGVVVSDGVNSHYEIQFNKAGDALSFAGSQSISLVNSTIADGSTVIKEVQKVVKPRRFVFDGTEIETANYVGGFADATEINARVFKWIDSNSNGVYEYDEIPIDGLVAAKAFNQATVNFTPEARIVGGQFTLSSTPSGSDVQFVTVKAGSFTLSFEGETTAVLSGNASILAIQNALNALAKIQATGSGGSGSVAVTLEAPNTYGISFNTAGAKSPVVAPFFYDYNNIF